MAKVALVTGGTRGIGSAVSIALHEAGFSVAASYAGNETAAAALKDKTGIAVFKWDVSDFDACAEGVRQVESELGPVDVLVNNAGITRDRMFLKMSREDQWRRGHGTPTSTSMFNVTQAGGRADMVERVTSAASSSHLVGQRRRRARPGQTNYSAAKAGDIGFVKALAQENANKGITVNAICPGYIGTEMVRAIDPDVLAKRILPHIPVGRLGEPEEIAGVVGFLASDKGGYITGSTITINGGQYMV